MSFMLSTNGYRVVPATSGQEAISIFARTQVDLVLADFAMPQMNGHQLVNRLKQIAGHVPMILLGDPQAMSGEIHAADALLAKEALHAAGIAGTDQGDERAQARSAEGHAAP